MGAEMLRRDLEDAGIAYAVDGPDGPEYADFHALRHTYLTMLGRNGVDLRTRAIARRSGRTGVLFAAWFMPPSSANSRP